MESGLDRGRRWWRRVGPVLADTTLIGLSTLVALTSIVSSPGWVDLPLVALAGIGFVGTTVLLRRRQWPAPVALVGLAVFCSTFNPVAMCAGLFTTAVRGRDRILVGTTAIVVGGLMVWDQATNTASPAESAFRTVGLMAPFVAIGAYVGVRRDLVAGLRDRAERAEAERELRAEQARTAERARIAREMHDVLAHKVSLIALHAGALEVNADAGAAHVEESAALIRSTARQTLEELREVLGVLRSDVEPDGADVTPTARSEDIARLVEASRSAGATVTLDGEVPDLPDATARAVHRIVQEALTNVNKHARAAATVVDVRGDEAAGVTVAVVNVRPVAAGLISDALPGAGSGLLGLAERVRLAGGTIDCGPEPDGGWAVRAWLPWNRPVDEGAPGRRTVEVGSV